MTIKPGDKFKTRDGHEVEITKIRDGEYPIIGRLGTFGANTKGWTADGHYYADKRPSDLDLVFPPERKSRWVNWYGTSSGGTEYKTREEADDYSLAHRTHVLEIIIENGEPVDVKINKVER